MRSDWLAHAFPLGGLRREKECFPLVVDQSTISPCVHVTLALSADTLRMRIVGCGNASIRGAPRADCLEIVNYGYSPA